MRVAPIFLLCLLQATAAAVEIPQPTFYLSLEGSTTAALAVGSPAASFAAQRDPILSLVESRRNKFTPGQVGLCYDVNDAPLIFACDGNFRPDEGTCNFWLSPHFDGDDTNLYCTFFGAADWGMLYKYVSQTTLSFGTARPEGDLYYDCGSSVLSTWRVDQWYHVVLTWSRQQNARCIFVDGKLVANAPFPFHRKTDGGEFFVGAGCTMFPGYIAHARIDEMAIWDRALDESVVVQLHKLGLQGKPLWLVETMPEPTCC